jgi:lipopolysaccharide/colanic/teichoic acid biosynthesis glycosyltransferase
MPTCSVCSLDDDSQIVLLMEFYVGDSAFALSSGNDDSQMPPCGYARLKRGVDCVAAVLMLGLAAPVLALAALLVKLTSRGPAFYSQVRLGLGGRPFRIYKIRSMHSNAEALTGPCWSTRGDRRVTPVGRLLRWSHIDELPQLWNVLLGDMSVIGPRPERPELVPALEKALPGYRARLLVRPGITGLAQVQLPPDTDLSSVRVKLAHDLCYIKHLGFGLDCRIFLATVFRVLGTPVGVTRQVFALPAVTAAPASHWPAAQQPAAVPDFQPMYVRI